MDTLFQNSEIDRLCSSLNTISQHRKYRVTYDNTLNALDFITDGAVKVATGLEIDINESCLYRLKYKQFDLKDGRTGYCLPMDMVFRKLETSIYFKEIEIDWLKNRLYPSVFLTDEALFQEQIRNTNLNIQREIEVMLKEYVISPTVASLVGADNLSLVNLVNNLITFVVEGNLIQENGRIKNIDPFPKIIFDEKSHFSFEELFKVVRHHIREKEVIGSFINY